MIMIIIMKAIANITNIRNIVISLYLENTLSEIFIVLNIWYLTWKFNSLKENKGIGPILQNVIRVSSHFDNGRDVKRVFICTPAFLLRRFYLRTYYPADLKQRARFNPTQHRLHDNVTSILEVYCVFLKRRRPAKLLSSFTEIQLRMEI